MRLCTITIYEYGNDTRSYEHYLNSISSSSSSSSSSDNKVWNAQAWIFFRPCFHYNLRGDLCKSSPGYFASEKKFSSNFAQ